ncbi:MAG: aminoglycoside phosphotransferase family protein [Gaiellaceae bacterium]
MNDVMHPGELALDEAVVRRLVDTQFPQWAGLPLERVGSSGTVNVLYRLGDELVVRLPRVCEGGKVWSRGAFDRDREWLPQLAPLLPAAVPEPLAKGAPGEDYPTDWAVYAWLPGEHPDPERLAEPGSLARQLAGFIRALRAVETGRAPESGRGSSLERWDEPTRAALHELEGSIDTAAALADWERALAAAPWDGAPVWAHGDLMPANLLLQGTRLTGVLDWGGAGLGDPAIDLQPAWNSLSGHARGVFREELHVDDASWERGRGWALWTGIVALPYYRETNPELAGNAAFRIGQVLGAG